VENVWKRDTKNQKEASLKEIKKRRDKKILQSHTVIENDYVFCTIRCSHDKKSGGGRGQSGGVSG
jgi:hypothetical protein